MKHKIENIFLIILMAFGLASILLIPPFQSPDESNHYKRAYSISQGYLYSEKVDNDKALLVDDALMDYVSKFDELISIEHKYSYADLYYDQELPKLPTSKNYQFFSTVDTSFIAYIPSVIGIIVSKCFRFFIFHSSTTYAYSLYFARLFNLITYAVLMYYAIKKSPILKKTIFTFGLLPMCVMLASSCSYDAVIIGCSCLTFSYIMRFIFNDEHSFTYKHVILFILFGFILFYIKYTYILLLLLLFFIPIDKFENKKDKYKKISMIFISIILLYLLFNIPNYINSVSVSSADSQLKFIISNPFKYLYILFRSLYSKFGLQLAWILGGFGNLDTHFPGFIYFIMLIYLLILMLIDSSIKKEKINFKFKITTFIILVLIILGIYTALYIIWTPIGNDIIEGVQGRYFLPIIFYIPLLFLGNKVLIRFKTLNAFIKDYYFWFTTVFLGLYCIMLFLRFWC